MDSVARCLSDMSDGDAVNFSLRVGSEQPKAAYRTACGCATEVGRLPHRPWLRHQNKMTALGGKAASQPKDA